MYERFYRLRERPFALTPNPAFLFPSRTHEKALSYLRASVDGQADLLVLTGEIGAGKTTLLQTALRGLQQRRAVAWLVNTSLEPYDLLTAIMLDFDLRPEQEQSKPVLVRDLTAFLDRELRRRGPALLVIDEAQNLGIQALAEVRMLSNLEAGGTKLLQVVLVGQPDLRVRLDRPELETFKQQIAASYHLRALSPGDTSAYVNHRLRRVALGPPLEFPPDACSLIHSHSGGIPRRINVIADAVLMFGYGAGARVIDYALTATTIAELQATGLLAAARGSRGEMKPATTAAPRHSRPPARPVTVPVQRAATSRGFDSPAMQSIPMEETTAFTLPRERTPAAAQPRPTRVAVVVASVAAAAALTFATFIESWSPRWTNIADSATAPTPALDLEARPIATTGVVPQVIATLPHDVASNLIVAPQPDVASERARGALARATAEPLARGAAGNGTRVASPSSAVPTSSSPRPSVSPSPIPATPQAPPSATLIPAEQPAAPTAIAEPPRAEIPTPLPPPPPTARRAELLSPPAAAALPGVEAPAARLERADEAFVQSVLNEYRSAYNSLDAQAAKAVWPSVDTRALSRSFRNLEWQQLDFANCAISVSATRAVASCGGLARYVPKIGNQSTRLESRRWRFELQKAEERWTIAAVDAR